MDNPGYQAKHVRQVEEDIGGLEEGLAEIRLLHEAVALAESIFGDHVAGAGLEDVVHLQDLTRATGFLHVRDHPRHVLFHNRFKTSNAGNREEAVESVSPPAMKVMGRRRDN